MRQNTLVDLAGAAGIETSWRDVRDETHVVGPNTLRADLLALGLPAAGDEQIADSIEELRVENEDQLHSLVTVELGASILMPITPGRFRLTLESGSVVERIVYVQSH